MLESPSNPAANFHWKGGPPKVGTQTQKTYTCTIKGPGLRKKKNKIQRPGKGRSEGGAVRGRRRPREVRSLRAGPEGLSCGGCPGEGGTRQRPDTLTRKRETSTRAEHPTHTQHNAQYRSKVLSPECAEKRERASRATSEFHFFMALSWLWMPPWCLLCGAMELRAAQHRKERTYPELTGCFRRARLVVLACEVGGRWSEEANNLLLHLAKAKVRGVPQPLKTSAKQSWLWSWRSMLACPAAKGFASHCWNKEVEQELMGQLLHSQK